MPRQPAASFDPTATSTQRPRRGRAQVVAGVGRSTGPLVGMDAVLIDASAGSLQAMARLRNRYLCPAILDLPAAGTGPVYSPLTTSELLVFASAERFDWVNLRGVSSPDGIRRARAVLHPEIRLAVAANPSVVDDASLAQLCREADALVLDCSEILASAGAQRFPQLLQGTFDLARLHAVPFMIRGRLLPRPDSQPSHDDVEWVNELLASGARYLILDAAQQAETQATLDMARLLADAHAEHGERRQTRQKAASLSGRLTP